MGRMEAGEWREGGIETRRVGSEQRQRIGKVVNQKRRENECRRRAECVEREEASVLARRGG